MNLADCYRVLGLRTGAPFADIKASYRRLARQYHPDVNPNDQRAKDKFIQVAEAYKQLSQAVPHGDLDSAEDSCKAGMIYYNPVAQFVAGHFEQYEFGCKPLERVKISQWRDLVGQTGVDDEVHILKEMEANAGYAEADLWLARGYFFGYNGVERDIERALRQGRLLIC